MTSFQSSEASFKKATEKFENRAGENTTLNLITYQEYYKGQDTRFSKELSKAMLEDPNCLGVFIVPPEIGIDHHVENFNKKSNSAFGMGTGTLILRSKSLGKEVFIYKAKGNRILKVKDNFESEIVSNNYQYDWIRIKLNDDCVVSKDEFINLNLVTTMDPFNFEKSDTSDLVRDDLSALSNLVDTNNQLNLQKNNTHVSIQASTAPGTMYGTPGLDDKVSFNSYNKSNDSDRIKAFMNQDNIVNRNDELLRVFKPAKLMGRIERAIMLLKK